MSALSAPRKMTALDGGTEQGITWCTVMSPIPPAINGYVEVPEGHPWSDLGYGEIDVEVHGGLTFADRGWIGFDTMHAGDVWPRSLLHTASGRDWDIHWTPEKVADETRSLARKVAEAQQAANRSATFRFAGTPQVVTR